MKFAIFSEIRQDLESAARTYRTIYGNILELYREKFTTEVQRMEDLLYTLDVLALRMLRILVDTDFEESMSNLRKHEMNVKSIVSFEFRNSRRYNHWSGKFNEACGYILQNSKVDKSAYFYKTAALNFRKDRNESSEIAEPEKSKLILRLLTKAYETYKKENRTRMTLFIASLIAEEYDVASRPELSIKFYDRISKAYKNEKWKVLTRHTLEKTLLAAIKLENFSLQNYSRMLLCSPSICPLETERLEFCQEISDFGCTLELGGIFDCIKTSFRFIKNKAAVNETVQYQITIYNNFLKEIKFDELHLAFSIPTFNLSLKHAADEETDEIVNGLNFGPQQKRVYTNSLIPLTQDENLKCEMIILKMGKVQFCCPCEDKHVKWHGDTMGTSFADHRTLEVVSLKPKVELNVTSKTIFVGEKSFAVIHAFSELNVNLQMNASVEGLNLAYNGLTLKDKIDLGNLEGEKEYIIEVFSSLKGTFTLSVEFFYSCFNTNYQTKIQKEIFVVEPFQVEFDLQSNILFAKIIPAAKLFFDSVNLTNGKAICELDTEYEVPFTQAFSLTDSRHLSLDIRWKSSQDSEWIETNRMYSMHNLLEDDRLAIDYRNYILI